MDIATGLGLVGGAIVVATVILMGGSFGMYFPIVPSSFPAARSRRP
jgi:hypothetical protein